MYKKVLILALLCPVILAECCHKKQINFQMRTHADDCSNYERAKNNVRRGTVGIADVLSGRCKVSLCGDGKRATGSYCGVGSCNMFGCNCDGGCIEGDAVAEFKKRFGDAVGLIHQDKTDELVDEIYSG